MADINVKQLSKAIKIDLDNLLAQMRRRDFLTNQKKILLVLKIKKYF